MWYMTEHAGKVQAVTIKKKITSLRLYHVNCGLPIEVSMTHWWNDVFEGSKGSRTTPPASPH